MGSLKKLGLIWNIAVKAVYYNNLLKMVNQLPHLSGRWVPGLPGGFYCGQPAPR